MPAVNLYAYVQNDPILRIDPYGDRSLTTGKGSEEELAKSIFGSDIDYGIVQIYNKDWIYPLPLEKRPMTVDKRSIYYDKDCPYYSGDISKSKKNIHRYTFIHEMTHIWQYQKDMWVKSRRQLLAEWDYDYRLCAKKGLTDYGIEQQGSIVADFYYKAYLGKPPLEAEYPNHVTPSEYFNVIYSSVKP